MQRFSKQRRLLILALALTTMVCQDANSQIIQGDRVRGKAKPLATGVLQVIPPDLDARDSHSLPLVLPGVNAKEYDPNFAAKKDTLYGSTRNIVFFRDVWNYEYAFLPLRQTSIDGRNVWYMIYRIRNTGATLTYEQVKEKFDHIKFDLRRNEKEIIDKKFLPRFSLEGWVTQQGKYDRVTYRDQLNPRFVKIIQSREDRNRPLLNTIEMSRTEIPMAKNSTDPGVWGVAVWEDIDPRIDYVSVFVNGLTNAHRINQASDGKIGMKYRTLQLNFWRPGDTQDEIRDDIDYGIPMVDDPAEQVEICRRYDLPGPVFRAYRIDAKANQDVMVLETDAEMSLSTFKSALVPELDSGKLPPALAKAFADAGYSIPANVAVVSEKGDDTDTSVVEAATIKWKLKDSDGQEYVIRLEPQFWEPDFKGSVRFIRSLDHFWIYR